MAEVAPDHTGVPIAELLSLRGRSAVVTGGARGIGAGICRRLAEAGAMVTVADRDGEGAARMAAALGPGHRDAHVDITDTAALSRLADGVEGLRKWVDNAGIFPATGPGLDAGDDVIDRMLLVNVRGTFAAAREAARRMTAGGVIVNGALA